MADKENCVRITRSQSRKRSAASLQAANPQPPSKRKRPALAEISISVNVAPNQKSPVKRKTRLSKKKEEEEEEEEKKKAALTAIAVADEVSKSDVDDDPQMCAHYAKDIHQYLRSMEMETKRRPLTNFIEKIQTDVTANMRGTLVDWLVEVAEEYKLIPDTLYLTVSYIDRFLSTNAISRQKLQLLGVSAMLVASYGS